MPHRRADREVPFSTTHPLPPRVSRCQGILLGTLAAVSLLHGVPCPSQNSPSSEHEGTGSQLKVNWLYGSYVPKDVELVPLNKEMRWKLYVRSTYATWGIYVKTTIFATRDQIRDRYPEWGDGFGGFAKRLGTRQSEFVIQNSMIALGDGLVGWEPRYDRCHCTGIWPRTKHAFVRNFVTYNGTEKSLRPQLMPYVGAFAGSTISSQWAPGKPQWQIKGYQAVITQVPVGMGINWVSEFAPQIFGMFQRHKAK